MQTEFVPHGVYEDIINLLGQWKVLDIKSLSRLCNYDVQYYNLLHKVRKLEKHGLIKGVLTGRKNKHIYLTSEGLRLTPYDRTYEICDESLTHDLVVGNVLRTLLLMSNFTDGKMFHQIDEQSLFPDAEIVGSQNKESYHLALEVELTQKEQLRVKEKFRKYGNSKVFNYALFITNKEPLFKAYRRYLMEMMPEIQEAVILLLDEKLTVSRFDCENSRLFYLGKEIGFSDIFGERRI